MRHTEAVHKFKLNQVVNLVRAPFLIKSGSTSLKYEIVRLVPADTNGEISYRIKSGTEELAVREHEIKA
jgi:hypothetical protein